MFNERTYTGPLIYAGDGEGAGEQDMISLGDETFKLEVWFDWRGRQRETFKEIERHVGHRVSICLGNEQAEGGTNYLVQFVGCLTCGRTP